MRSVGIIAEYNPLHTGHKDHIQKARRMANADYTVVVMSPDFVQRGTPAIFDKYTRTRMALLAGADLVLELPICYATGSAEYFARGAIGMLDGVQQRTGVFFESEQPCVEDSAVYPKAGQGALLQIEHQMQQCAANPSLRQLPCL